MITVSLFHLVCVIAALAVGCVVYKLIKKVDDKIEKRRLAAFDVSTMLSLHGCVRLPLILRAYAVGDYSGAANEIRKICEAVEAGVPVMEAEFEKTFGNLLDASLKSESGRIVLKAKLDAAVAAVAPKVATAVAAVSA